ncbi:uncharacterized protein LOC113549738 isoform X2 [Rhopalosiphum maidis]|uniref:uncharacterized protein LOC113549738 isoform X2 n=1 Tax=Rhopalosiphum maidis TaxID=43146 RepID=UPI000EFE2DD3|nr:uncharacterized protein LOC113549738 isoform X2 [Rhopalosiphum maidis]
MESRKTSVRTDEIETFDEPEDDFLTSSKHHQTHQLRIWEGENIHEDPKNAESYEIEKREVIITVNNFVTKLYIESQRFKNNDNITGEKYEEMDDLMDRVEVAHDLITRLRQLLTMEKTDSVMDHSLNRTRFFKMDDDYKTQNEERENNRRKALVEKKRKVKLFSETIDSITERYNSVVETINAPNDYKFLEELKTNTIPLELKKKITKKKRDTKNEGHGNKEASSILCRSPFDILNDRIVDSDVKPTYRIIGTDVVSYKTIYNYSCTLYGLYVEGKGSKKEKAKENAATEMIRQILNEQNAKTLANHFKPFNEQEINELQALFKTKQNYTEFLEEMTKEDIPLPLVIKSKVRRSYIAK